MINNVPRYSFLSLAFLVLCGGLFLSFLFLHQKPAPAKADSSVVRGQAYDKWADVVIGKRDFTEITDNKTTANRVMGGGIAVDDRTDPGFASI